MQIPPLFQQRFHPPVTTTQDFLLCLGRSLLPYFPLAQVQEILLDYQEYLAAGQERGSTEEALLKSMDAPEHIARTIWEESLNRSSFRFRKQALGWIQLLAATLLFFYFASRFHPHPLYITAILLSLSAAALSCFGLLHGWERIALEQQFGPAPRRSRPFWLILFLFPAAAVALTELLMQKLIRLPSGSIPAHIAGISTGTLCDQIFLILMSFTALLALWTLFRTWKESTRYYIGFIPACGAFLSLQDMRSLLHNMDLVSSRMIQNAFFYSLFFYLASLVVTLLIAAFLTRQKKRAAFEQKEV